MILHPNTNKPDIRLLESYKNSKKQAEIDITDMTAAQVCKEIEMQEDQGRTIKYRTIKPYNWPQFDGEEVER